VANSSNAKNLRALLAVRPIVAGIGAAGWPNAHWTDQHGTPFGDGHDTTARQIHPAEVGDETDTIKGVSGKGTGYGLR